MNRLKSCAHLDSLPYLYTTTGMCFRNNNQIINRVNFLRLHVSLDSFPYNPTYNTLRFDKTATTECNALLATNIIDNNKYFRKNVSSTR